MKSLHRRLSILEHRPSPRAAAAHIADQRYTWSGRFAAHSQANAALVQRILTFRLPQGQYATAIVDGRVDTWDLFLIPLMYCDIGVDYPVQVGFPINPTPAAAEARALCEEMCAAANAYDAATGDWCPTPGSGRYHRSEA